MRRGHQHGNKSQGAQKICLEKTRPRCEKCELSPRSGFEWHFTCLKSRFLASMRVKIILGPKRVSSIFWHELLNSPVSSLVGIHATKNQAQYLLSQHSIPNRCTSWLCFSSYFTTLHELFECWHADSFSRTQKEKRVDSFERETSALLLRIHCREWAFKLKGVSGAISPNHSGGR